MLSGEHLVLLDHHVGTIEIWEDVTIGQAYHLKTLLDRLINMRLLIVPAEQDDYLPLLD